MGFSLPNPRQPLPAFTPLTWNPLRLFLTSSTGTDVGNLIGPIKIWEAFGVWLVDDFRLPPDRPELTYVLVGVVAVGVPPRPVEGPGGERC